jgi:hypothetical protein
MDEIFGTHRVLRLHGFVSITNLYYHSQPSDELRANLAEVPVHGIAERLRILVPDGWEIYRLESQQLATRSDEVVDTYADAICNASVGSDPTEIRDQLRERWRAICHVFNGNHRHLGFMELSLRNRPDTDAEQPELFLPYGGVRPVLRAFFRRVLRP